MPKLELRQKETKGDLIRGFSKVNADLGPKFRTEAESAKFPWPRETQRRNGSRVKSPRDVVDRGDFRDSYQHTARGAQHEHAWNAAHSSVVILGARLKNGTLMPARDVTSEPLKGLPDDFAKAVDS